VIERLQLQKKYLDQSIETLSKGLPSPRRSCAGDRPQSAGPDSRRAHRWPRPETRKHESGAPPHQRHGRRDKIIVISTHNPRRGSTRFCTRAIIIARGSHRPPTTRPPNWPSNHATTNAVSVQLDQAGPGSPALCVRALAENSGSGPKVEMEARREGRLTALPRAAGASILPAIAELATARGFQAE